ncbi:rubrerythrin [Clostridium acetireducens DSM 10703]|jgi:rubrerythrin|uniref:Rubrerythrin n=1 Tax=Clostridium acetireducens DSM 10703 TaxID=1121290 RepID=A0A1E8EW75_9CLOT|nr:ferritin-like domain-containing protein [Clostridium acetireducens]OFI01509.1 rubrerythrin [Clostridium acetireducens DSM 10703]
MSYTTKHQPQGKVYCYTNKIREAIIAEIVAINDYAYHIANSKIKEINEVWHHIMEDEKRHYGMFLQLLREFDPIQYKKYIEVKDHIKLSVKTEKQDYCSNYCNEITLNNIRNDIKGELEAVILYEQHIVEIPFKRVRDVFLEVINDEKEHLEELTAVLLKYDKDKYGPIE